MSDTSTAVMVDAYIEHRVSPPLFLTSFFKTHDKSFHDSEDVEVDVKRGEPYIAIPVQSVKSGARKHEGTKATNKRVKPPVYDLETVLGAWSAMARRPGQNPFSDPVFRQNVQDEAFDNLGELENMMRRAVELQSAQVLQTGKVSLVDASNLEIWGIDYLPKATHFATVGTAWAADGSTGDPEADIDALSIVIRRDGKRNVTDLVFGATARARFTRNAKVLARFDNLGLQPLTSIVPSSLSDVQNATLFAVATLGGYKYRCWFYDDYYIDPVTGNPTPYVADDKIIFIAEPGRRDLSFGSIPIFAPPEASAMQFLPTRMSSAGQGFDLTTNIWLTPDHKHLTLSAGTRPLALPVAIDTFGCLDVVP